MIKKYQTISLEHTNFLNKNNRLYGSTNNLLYDIRPQTTKELHMDSNKYRNNFYFIQLNLQKCKHKDLIEWIKKTANEEEQSLSSLCIKIIKNYMEQVKNKNESK